MLGRDGIPRGGHRDNAAGQILSSSPSLCARGVSADCLSLLQGLRKSRERSLRHAQEVEAKWAGLDVSECTCARVIVRMSDSIVGVYV